MNFHVAAVCAFQIFVVYGVQTQEAFVFVWICCSAIGAAHDGFSMGS